MSQAALALLEDGSKGDSEPVKSPAQRAIDMLEGRTQPPSVVKNSMGAFTDRNNQPELLPMLWEGGKEFTQSLLHGAGTLADVATGTSPGAGSHAEHWASMIPTDPTMGGRVSGQGAITPDQVSGAYDKSFGEGPLAQTVKERLPQAAEAIGMVTGAGEVANIAKGGVSALRAPKAPVADPLEQFGADSLSSAAAVPSKLKTATPELQAAVRAQAREGGVDRVALDRHLEADSLPIPMRLTEGQATGDVEQLSHEQNRRGKDPELASRFHEQNQQLIDNLDEIRREAAPNVVGNDHIQNGQTLIDSYKAYDETVRADIKQKYDALREANGGEFPVDGQTFVAQADTALKKAFKGRYVPPQVAADLEAIRSGEVAMDFEQFENLRTNLAAEARKAERSGDGNAKAAVNIVRELLESLPMTGEAANLKPIADAARQAAKARFDRLRADPAYKAVADDDVAAGEASPLADDFIRKYVVKGKSSNIDRMRESLQGDPTAAETITAGALNYLKSKSGVDLYTNEGNFSQAGYNRALSELTPKLNKLVGPQRAEQVQTLGNVARYTQAQPRGSFVNNSNTTVAAHAAGLAKGVAERGVNAVLPGAELGTLAREKIEARSGKKFVRDALKPGAGLRPKAPKP